MLKYVCLKQRSSSYDVLKRTLTTCRVADEVIIRLKYAAVTVTTVQAYGRVHENTAQLPRKRTQEQYTTVQNALWFCK